MNTNPHPPNLTGWEKLVTLVQHMWDHSNLPTENIWNILVFIPKVNAYTWGVGLIEVLWKFVETVIRTQVKIAV